MHNAILEWIDWSFILTFKLLFSSLNQFDNITATLVNTH